jgi:pimeloyl-ACP methyl ester carboxylesterase
MELLAPTHHVLAPDSYGSGKSPAWHPTRPLSLADKVDFIRPVLDRLASPMILVGHSYGAAVALKTALLFPERVRALALYEPTLFSLIPTLAPNDADGILEAVAAAITALEANDRDAAARAFIDYWMGQGAWANTPPQRKQPILDSIVNVRHWSHALTNEPASLDSLRRLRMPILYMVGKHTHGAGYAPASREPGDREIH